jgi:hypothetical protein
VSALWNSIAILGVARIVGDICIYLVLRPLRPCGFFFSFFSAPMW